MNITSSMYRDFLRAFLWRGVCINMKDVARTAKVQILSPSRTVAGQMHIVALEGVKEPHLSPEVYRAAVAPERGLPEMRDTLICMHLRWVLKVVKLARYSGTI
jgi:hypothetical protein